MCVRCVISVLRIHFIFVSFHLLAIKTCKKSNSVEQFLTARLKLVVAIMKSCNDETVEQSYGANNDWVVLRHWKRTSCHENVLTSQHWCCRCAAVPSFKQMFDRPHDYNTTIGSDVVFRCDAYAVPEATVIWYKNGEQINSKSLYCIILKVKLLFTFCTSGCETFLGKVST